MKKMKCLGGFRGEIKGGLKEIYGKFSAHLGKNQILGLETLIGMALPVIKTGKG